MRLAMNPFGEGVMDRRQFLLAVPGGALLVASASAREPGRLYRVAVVSPAELAAEQVRSLQLPELARFGFRRPSAAPTNRGDWLMKHRG